MKSLGRSISNILNVKNKWAKNSFDDYHTMGLNKILMFNSFSPNMLEDFRFSKALVIKF